VDEQGWVTLVGKKAEMIRLRTAGHVLSPSKIETLLRGHPVIEEALVIGNDREYLTAVLNPIKLSSRKRKAGVQGNPYNPLPLSCRSNKICFPILAISEDCQPDFKQKTRNATKETGSLS